jgi:hypothetical protein
MKFCTSCGAAGTETQTAPAAQTAPVTPAAQACVRPAEEVYREEPVSTGGYFGILFLMMLPVVNLLLMILWACGGCRKVNKRNLARALLLWTAVGCVLSMVVLLMWRLLFGSEVNAWLESVKSMGGMVNP